MLQNSKNPQKISLFDLDHTLLSVNSSFCFGKYLYRHRFFKASTMLRLIGIYALHKAGILSLKAVHAKTFKLIFFGKDARAIKNLMPSFLDDFLKKHSYFPAVQRLEQAKSEGHLTYILSNSPDFIVGPISDLFKVDGWRATSYEVDALGYFSNITDFVEGVEKANYLNSFARQFNLAKENSIAYSDSFLDLPFLKEAGVAVAVNPDKKLKKYSIKKSWEIL